MSAEMATRALQDNLTRHFTFLQPIVAIDSFRVNNVTSIFKIGFLRKIVLQKS